MKLDAWGLASRVPSRCHLQRGSSCAPCYAPLGGPNGARKGRPGVVRHADGPGTTLASRSQGAGEVRNSLAPLSPQVSKLFDFLLGTGARGIGGGRSPQISTEMMPPCGDMELFRWKRQGDWWTEESGWAVAISMFKAIWVGSSGVLWCFLAVGAAWRLLESYRALCCGLTASHHPGGWAGHLLRHSRRGS